MARTTRPKLIVPALLVFSVIESAGCGGDSLDDVECYDRNKKECTAESVRACIWDGNACYPDCKAHKKESACNDDETCAWFGGMCGMHV